MRAFSNLSFLSFFVACSSYANTGLTLDDLYSGTGGMDNSCGSQGRIVYTSELQKIPNWCSILSEYGIKKIQGEHLGELWQAMGSGYQCQLKRGAPGDEKIDSLCIKRIEPD